MTEQECEDAINDAPDLSFWMEEETAAEARDRMTPIEREADLRFSEAPRCGLCQEDLQPNERTVCDFCHGVQTREYNQ